MDNFFNGNPIGSLNILDKRFKNSLLNQDYDLNKNLQDLKSLNSKELCFLLGANWYWKINSSRHNINKDSVPKEIALLNISLYNELSNYAELLVDSVPDSEELYNNRLEDLESLVNFLLDISDISNEEYNYLYKYILEGSKSKNLKVVKELELILLYFVISRIDFPNCLIYYILSVKDLTVGNFNKILDQYPNLATIIKTKLNQLGFNYALIESCSRYYSAGFLTSYVNPNLHMDRLNIDSFVRDNYLYRRNTTINNVLVDLDEEFNEQYSNDFYIKKFAGLELNSRDFSRYNILKSNYIKRRLFSRFRSRRKRRYFTRYAEQYIRRRTHYGKFNKVLDSKSKSLGKLSSVFFLSNYNLNSGPLLNSILKRGDKYAWDGVSTMRIQGNEFQNLLNYYKTLFKKEDLRKIQKYRNFNKINMDMPRFDVELPDFDSVRFYYNGLLKNFLINCRNRVIYRMLKTFLLSYHPMLQEYSLIERNRFYESFIKKAVPYLLNVIPLYNLSKLDLYNELILRFLSENSTTIMSWMNIYRRRTAANLIMYPTSFFFKQEYPVNLFNLKKSRRKRFFHKRLNRKYIKKATKSGARNLIYTYNNFIRVAKSHYYLNRNESAFFYNWFQNTDYLYKVRFVNYCSRENISNQIIREFFILILTKYYLHIYAKIWCIYDTRIFSKIPFNIPEFTNHKDIIYVLFRIRELLEIFESCDYKRLYDSTSYGIILSNLLTSGKIAAYFEYILNFGNNFSISPEQQLLRSVLKNSEFISYELLMVFIEECLKSSQNLYINLLKIQQLDANEKLFSKINSIRPYDLLLKGDAIVEQSYNCTDVGLNLNQGSFKASNLKMPLHLNHDIINVLLSESSNELKKSDRELFTKSYKTKIDRESLFDLINLKSLQKANLVKKSIIGFNNEFEKNASLFSINERILRNDVGAIISSLDKNTDNYTDLNYYNNIIQPNKLFKHVISQEQSISKTSKSLSGFSGDAGNYDLTRLMVSGLNNGYGSINFFSKLRYKLRARRRYIQGALSFLQRRKYQEHPEVFAMTLDTLNLRTKARREEFLQAWDEQYTSNVEPFNYYVNNRYHVKSDGTRTPLDFFKLRNYKKGLSSAVESLHYDFKDQITSNVSSLDRSNYLKISSPSLRGFQDLHFKKAQDLFTTHFNKASANNSKIYTYDNHYQLNFDNSELTLKYTQFMNRLQERFESEFSYLVSLLEQLLFLLLKVIKLDSNLFNVGHVNDYSLIAPVYNEYYFNLMNLIDEFEVKSSRLKIDLNKFILNESSKYLNSFNSNLRNYLLKLITLNFDHLFLHLKTQPLLLFSENINQFKESVNYLNNKNKKFEKLPSSIELKLAYIFLIENKYNQLNRKNSSELYRKVLNSFLIFERINETEFSFNPKLTDYTKELRQYFLNNISLYAHNEAVSDVSIKLPFSELIERFNINRFFGLPGTKPCQSYIYDLSKSAEIFDSIKHYDLSKELFNWLVNKSFLNHILYQFSNESNINAFWYYRNLDETMQDLYFLRPSRNFWLSIDQTEILSRSYNGGKVLKKFSFNQWYPIFQRSLLNDTWQYNSGTSFNDNNRNYQTKIAYWKLDNSFRSDFKQLLHHYIKGTLPFSIFENPEGQKTLIYIKKYLPSFESFKPSFLYRIIFGLDESLSKYTVSSHLPLSNPFFNLKDWYPFYNSNFDFTRSKGRLDRRDYRWSKVRVSNIKQLYSDILKDYSLAKTFGIKFGYKYVTRSVFTDILNLITNHNYSLKELLITYINQIRYSFLLDFNNSYFRLVVYIIKLPYYWLKATVINFFAFFNYMYIGPSTFQKYILSYFNVYKVYFYQIDNIYNSSKRLYSVRQLLGYKLLKRFNDGLLVAVKDKLSRSVKRWWVLLTNLEWWSKFGSFELYHFYRLKLVNVLNLYKQNFKDSFDINLMNLGLYSNDSYLNKLVSFSYISKEFDIIQSRDSVGRSLFIGICNLYSPIKLVLNSISSIFLLSLKIIFVFLVIDFFLFDLLLLTWLKQICFNIFNKISYYFTSSLKKIKLGFSIVNTKFDNLLFSLDRWFSSTFM